MAHLLLRAENMETGMYLVVAKERPRGGRVRERAIDGNGGLGEQIGACSGRRAIDKALAETTN